MGNCHPSKTNVNLGFASVDSGDNFPRYPLVQSIFIKYIFKHILLTYKQILRFHVTDYYQPQQRYYKQILLPHTKHPVAKSQLMEKHMKLTGAHLLCLQIVLPREREQSTSYRNVHCETEYSAHLLCLQIVLPRESAKHIISKYTL